MFASSKANCTQRSTEGSYNRNHEYMHNGQGRRQIVGADNHAWYAMINSVAQMYTKMISPISQHVPVDFQTRWLAYKHHAYRFMNSMMLVDYKLTLYCTRKECLTSSHPGPGSTLFWYHNKKNVRNPVRSGWHQLHGYASAFSCPWPEHQNDSWPWRYIL